MRAPVLVGLVVVSLASVARAEDRTFAAGSLIIPMDLAYQDQGMYQAYGLLYQLLAQDIDVAWIIDPDKTWHAAPCNAGGDECAWDCAVEGSGVKCTYPTASPDFFAATEVVWSDVGTAPGTVITNHGYRGGPFVIDAADATAALAIIDAWNTDTGRTDFEVVTVHEATASFDAFVRKDMIAAPTIAVFADGNERIATSYLRAAGIPQSNGAEFPDAACGATNCGPGTANPDMLTVPSVAGDMGTCDAPSSDHANGALFGDDGKPAYCQIMSMHWNVTARETVECGGGDCPDTPEECAGVPITYHGHEVVAEVRSFLRYPTHFFAECQAVNAYENTVPNPAWPFLDDAGRLGHFLTTTGTPPPCPCDPGPDEGEFECVAGACVPKDLKEKGAGFLIADSPNPYVILRPEVAYMQYDGAFAPEGGSEPAYNLSTYLMTEYHNDQDVTFITAEDGPGVQDVWMTGYLDGECDIDEDPIVVEKPGRSLAHGPAPEYCGGKVSYLGGHSYAGKRGQRLFLNALFEADCVTNANWPQTGDSDTDGDGVPNGEDDFPNDPLRCGDLDGDTCDDCTSGSQDTANDGPDADSDGICDAGEGGDPDVDAGPGADGDGGSGSGCCDSSGRGGAGSGLLGLALLLMAGRARAARPARRRS